MYKLQMEAIPDLQELRPSMISTGLTYYGPTKQRHTRTNEPSAPTNKGKLRPISEGLLEQLEVEEQTMEVELSKPKRES